MRSLMLKYNEIKEHNRGIICLGSTSFYLLRLSITKVKSSTQNKIKSINTIVLYYNNKLVNTINSILRERLEYLT